MLSNHQHSKGQVTMYLILTVFIILAFTIYFLSPTVPRSTRSQAGQASLEELRLSIQQCADSSARLAVFDLAHHGGRAGLTGSDVWISVDGTDVDFPLLNQGMQPIAEEAERLFLRCTAPAFQRLREPTPSITVHASFTDSTISLQYSYSASLSTPAGTISTRSFVSSIPSRYYHAHLLFAEYLEEHRRDPTATHLSTITRAGTSYGFTPLVETNGRISIIRLRDISRSSRAFPEYTIGIEREVEGSE